MILRAAARTTDKDYKTPAEHHRAFQEAEDRLYERDKTPKGECYRAWRALEREGDDLEREANVKPYFERGAADLNPHLPPEFRGRTEDSFRRESDDWKRFREEQEKACWKRDSYKLRQEYLGVMDMDLRKRLIANNRKREDAYVELLRAKNEKDHEKYEKGKSKDWFLILCIVGFVILLIIDLTANDVKTLISWSTSFLLLTVCVCHSVAEFKKSLDASRASHLEWCDQRFRERLNAPQTFSDSEASSGMPDSQG